MMEEVGRGMFKASRFIQSKVDDGGGPLYVTRFRRAVGNQRIKVYKYVCLPANGIKEAHIMPPGTHTIRNLSAE